MVLSFIGSCGFVIAKWKVFTLLLCALSLLHNLLTTNSCNKATATFQKTLGM